MSIVSSPQTPEDVDGRDRPDHDGEGAAGNVTIPATARAYTLTIWAIALGIFVQAAATVAWALSIRNDQLFKDGVDWVYDVILYGIAALVFGRDSRAEKLAALGIGAVMAVAGLHTLYDLWDKIVRPRPIEFWTLGFAAVSMVLIGLCVVAALFRFRRESNPVIKATWLSARNDAVATFGFAIVGLVARILPVRWPEYVFDVVVAGLCFQATWAIWRSVRAQGAVRNKAATDAALPL
ncbi:MAG: cation transporter [Beijerinckiaceae bacterium]|nr:cation transporter [Beijerinckiaceae bacterium]